MRFKGTLICIHGFLGQTRDWDPILPMAYHSVRVDLFSSQAQVKFPRIKAPQKDLKNLGSWMNKTLKDLKTPRILIGYSLGGRLALHALLSHPTPWSGAVLISTHPGFSENTEKQKRVKADEVWAKRFEEDSWDSVIQDWNNQPVFLKSKPSPYRHGPEFSRKSLAHALRCYSLGKQNLLEQLHELSVPTLWIYGDLDLKFKQIHKELSLKALPLVKTLSIPSAGHRVLFEQAEKVQQALVEYLERREDLDSDPKILS